MSLKISLVLCTLNRTVELERYLSYLNCQSYRNFELIIVDQNKDDRLVPIIKQYSSVLPIIFLRSSIGSSHARNVGLGKISGDLIGFPDDDCWYERTDLLNRIVGFFEEDQDLDGLIGIIDMGDIKNGQEIQKPVKISTAVLNAPAPGIFLRREVFSAVGWFDEDFGLNAKYGASEDPDYIIRTIKNNFRIEYIPSLRIQHPKSVPVLLFDNKEFCAELNLSKVHSYGYSIGALLRKHKLSFPVSFYYCLRPFVMMVITFFYFKFKHRNIIECHCGAG